MSETVNATEALYRQMLEALDLLGISYNKNDDETYVYSSMKGNDVAFEYTLSIDRESLTLNLVSPIRMKKKDKTKFDVAIAVGIANSFFCDGCFDYDLESGSLYWRNCQFLEGSVINKDMLKYVIYTSFNTVEGFRNRFSSLSEGKLSLDGFLRGLNG